MRNRVRGSSLFTCDGATGEDPTFLLLDEGATTPALGGGGGGGGGGGVVFFSSFLPSPDSIWQ